MVDFFISPLFLISFIFALFPHSFFCLFLLQRRGKTTPGGRKMFLSQGEIHCKVSVRASSGRVLQRAGHYHSCSLLETTHCVISWACPVSGIFLPVTQCCADFLLRCLRGAPTCLPMLLTVLSSTCKEFTLPPKAVAVPCSPLNFLG